MLRPGKTYYLLATELPELMTDPDFLTLTRPLSQFIADWNTRPEAREKMLDGKPDCEMFYLARIAAIIHALCLRDEVPIPDWVFDAKLPEPEIIVDGVDAQSNYGKLVISQSPTVSEYHNVYFQAEMLDKATDRQSFHPISESGEPWTAVENV